MEEPETKKIVYNIFAPKDYSAPTYNNIQTTFKRTLDVASIKTGDYTKLWATTFTGHWTSFPPSHQKIQSEKLYSIVDSAEHLQVSYNIRYNNSGQVEQVSGIHPGANGIVLIPEHFSL